MNAFARPVALATLVAGTLDLSAACISAWLRTGATPDVIFRAVASGPFGDAAQGGGAGMAVAGVLVHYGIMAVIAAVFVLAASRIGKLPEEPLRWGLLYGVGVYIVMELIVLPLRWPAAFPKTDASHVLLALAFMTMCVGVPIALIAARFLGRRPATDLRLRAL